MRSFIKYSFTVTLLFLVFISSLAQENDAFENAYPMALIDGDWKKVELDQEPIYLDGGEKGMLMNIYRDIRYPAKARDKSVEGTVCTGIHQVSESRKILRN